MKERRLQLPLHEIDKADDMMSHITYVRSKSTRPTTHGETKSVNDNCRKLNGFKWTTIVTLMILHVTHTTSVTSNSKINFSNDIRSHTHSTTSTHAGPAEILRPPVTPNNVPEYEHQRNRTLPNLNGLGQTSVDDSSHESYDQSKPFSTVNLCL